MRWRREFLRIADAFGVGLPTHDVLACKKRPVALPGFDQDLAGATEPAHRGAHGFAGCLELLPMLVFFCGVEQNREEAVLQVNELFRRNQLPLAVDINSHNHYSILTRMQSIP